MDPKTAQLILFTIAGFGAMVWLIAARFLVASYQACKRPASERFGFDQPPPSNLVLGGAEIEGQPEVLAAKAASAFAQGSLPLFGPVKILRRTEDEVRFESVVALPASRSNGSGQMTIQQGALHFTSVGPQRTRVDYAIDVCGGRGLLVGGVIFLILGLVALVGGFLLLEILVVRSEDLAVRGQVFQMFQAVHFLWPPFLFGALYRRRHTAVQSTLELAVHNLPYYGD